MAKAKTSITTENRSGSAVDAAAKEQRTEMPLSDLHPFEGHPFKVLDDELMEQTVESIKQIGVVSPLIVRPDPEGGFEILSGHRRLHAAQLAGLETVPVIVKEMDDDAAIIFMVDSNLQRENILPSERAFSYKMKLEAMKHQGQRGDLTSEDDVKKIAQVEGIEEYNLITIATVVNPVNFSRIEDSDMDQSTDVGGVNLRGNRIMEMDMDVSAGKISLIEGRMIEKDDRDVCVISKELAELNHLKTGNLLKFNDYHDKEHSTIYSAEIIGIYETKQERKSIMYGDSYRPENTIFTDMSFPEKPSGNEGNPFYQYAIFKVQNAGKYDQVKKSVQKANIDWSRYDLIDNNGNIKNMTENFGQMDQMSMGLLLIVSVSGLVILVLVFLFWIKNRTQEIGIMMSLGKCKFEIWVQFLWEAVMISIIGMLLSFAISPIIAETSASYLAKETQTLRLEQQEQENTGTYIDGYIAPDLKIQDVEVHITKEMVLMDIGMISGILIIAVLVAGITIMKKRPKQILSEMS